MLTFDQLSKTYADGTRALSGIDISVAAGEILALVGGSGCGKTTLLRLVAGLDRPSEGRILLGDAAITEPRADVGVIFQEPRLLPWLSVADNAGFGLSHLPAAERSRLVTGALARVGLAGYETRWPRELSGGQQQRVAIARSLAMRPKLMLFDEVTSALDPELTGEVLKVLESVAQEGMTMMLVTHEMGFARRFGSRVVFMHEGRIHEEGQAAAVLAEPKTPELTTFLSAVLH